MKKDEGLPVLDWRVYDGNSVLDYSRFGGDEVIIEFWSCGRIIRGEVLREDEDRYFVKTEYGDEIYIGKEMVVE